MRKLTPLLVFILFSVPGLTQNEKKMAKNLKVFVSDNFDKKASLTVQAGNDKGDLKGAFKNALSMSGFKVLSETSNKTQVELDQNKNQTIDSTEKKTTLEKTTYVKSNYIITLTYSGKMDPGQKQHFQCANLRGQIVDMNNDQTIVATFSYTGNFDPDPVAEAIANQLKK